MKTKLAPVVVAPSLRPPTGVTLAATRIRPWRLMRKAALFAGALLLGAGSAIAAEDWVKITSPTEGQTWTTGGPQTVKWQNNPSLAATAGVIGKLVLTNVTTSETYILAEGFTFAAAGTGTANVTLYGILPQGKYQLVLRALLPAQGGYSTPPGYDSRRGVTLARGTRAMLTLTEPARNGIYERGKPGRITWTYDPLLFPPAGSNYSAKTFTRAIRIMVGAPNVSGGTVLNGAYETGSDIAAGTWNYNYNLGAVGAQKIRIELIDSFGIFAECPITVDEPKILAGEPLAGSQKLLGSAMNVRWQYHTLLAGKKLTVTLHAGTQAVVIANGLDLAPGSGVRDGSLSWTIPNTVTAGNDCFVEYRIGSGPAPNIDVAVTKPASGNGVGKFTISDPGVVPTIENVWYRKAGAAGVITTDSVDFEPAGGAIEYGAWTKDKTAMYFVRAVWTNPDGRQVTEVLADASKLTYPTQQLNTPTAQKSFPANTGATRVVYRFKIVAENSNHNTTTSGERSVIVAPGNPPAARTTLATAGGTTVQSGSQIVGQSTPSTRVPAAIQLAPDLVVSRAVRQRDELVVTINNRGRGQAIFAAGTTLATAQPFGGYKARAETRIAAGGALTLRVPINAAGATAPATVPDRVKVQVDPENVVHETDETNNSGEFILATGAPVGAAGRRGA